MQNLISKTVFKAKALELFRQVEETGETMIVTDHGKPKLEVRLFRSLIRAPLDVLRGSVQHYERPTDPIADDEWESMR